LRNKKKKIAETKEEGQEWKKRPRSCCRNTSGGRVVIHEALGLTKTYGMGVHAKGEVLKKGGRLPKEEKGLRQEVTCYGGGNFRRGEKSIIKEKAECAD